MSTKTIILRTRFNKPVRESTTYHDIVDVYAYDKKARTLVVVGKKNMKEYVNAFYEISLLSNKLQRFQNGDLTALNSKQGVYADISGVPTDFNSLHKLVNEAMTSVRANGCESIPQYMQMIIDGIQKEDEPIKTDDKIIESGDNVE